MMLPHHGKHVRPSVNAGPRDNTSWSKSLLLPEPLLWNTLNINIAALNVIQYYIKSLAEG